MLKMHPPLKLSKNRICFVVKSHLLQIPFVKISLIPQNKASVSIHKILLILPLKSSVANKCAPTLTIYEKFRTKPPFLS